MIWSGEWTRGPATEMKREKEQDREEEVNLISTDDVRHMIIDEPMRLFCIGKFDKTDEWIIKAKRASNQYGKADRWVSVAASFFLSFGSFDRSLMWLLLSGDWNWVQRPLNFLVLISLYKTWSRRNIIFYWCRVLSMNHIMWSMNYVGIMLWWHRKWANLYRWFWHIPWEYGTTK